MKKILGTLVMFMVGCAATLSAKSWTNIAGFGFNLPTETSVTSSQFNNGKEIYMDKQCGFQGYYMGIANNGIAVRASYDTDYSEINQQIAGIDLIGADLMMTLGFGYAPVRNEHFTLAVFGTLGFDITAFYGETVRSDNMASNYKESYTKGYMAFMTGGNISAIFTPVKTFSILCACSVNYLTPGLYVEEYNNDSGVWANTANTYETDGSVKVTPTLGVCWKF